MESPYGDSYETGSVRGLRGGSYDYGGITLASSYRMASYPLGEDNSVGFRVAAQVPEPASIALFSLGALALIKRRRR